MDSDGILYIVVFAAAVFGLIGAVLLYGRDRAGTGALLGFFLGPIGLLIAAVMRLEPTKAAASAGMKKCPQCAETIQAEARKCRYCGSDIAPANAP